jgi:Protein of unknown function (DUF2721)
MEQMTFSTPAILFSTVSLLFIAFTNRYIAISSLVRDLHMEFSKDKSRDIIGQIKNLRKRLKLIQTMQTFSIISLLFSSAAMFLIFFELQILAKTTFGFGLAAQFVALCISAWEITLSTKALNIELSDMELEDNSIIHPIQKILKKGEELFD